MSGITAAKIVPMLMSSIITPKPERNSAVNSMNKISEDAAVRQRHSTSGAVNSRQPAT